MYLQYICWILLTFHFRFQRGLWEQGLKSVEIIKIKMGLFFLRV
jgi:hypothetical protein